MKTKVLNYKVLVEKENQPDGKVSFVTHVPTLGVSDYGQSIQEALDNTEKLIKFHVESLVSENEKVPTPDNPDNIFVANQQVKIETNKKIVFA